MTRGALIIGGSVAGVSAALDLAQAGVEVYLVERSPFLGREGAESVSPHILKSRLLEAAKHPDIHVLTGAFVTRLEDHVAEVQKIPRYVDLSKCTACAECEKVCPVIVIDQGRERPAIYKDSQETVPNVYVIEKRGVAPCKAACPGGIHVQGYVALIRQRKFAEALNLIREAIPFPGICGRVCTHPCEAVCRRGEYDEPIAIEYLKRFVADCEPQPADGSNDLSRYYRDEGRVAIVGAGPAGLTAAWCLAKEGYGVTVFEALPVAGGMMAVGIPEYRLPRQVLQSEIAAIKQLGVEIRTNTPIGPGKLSLDDLQEEYEAVFVAVGAHVSRRLAIPGENLEGVLPGVEFLREVALGRPPQAGPRVVVVGGGNVAIDSAMTARRLGGEQVTILYRRSREEMPASPWEVAQAEEEGVDVRFLASPVRILGQAAVSGLECVRMELGEPDESGRRRPIPIEGSEFVIEADTVIAAIGQAVGASLAGLEATKGGTFVADPVTLATNRPGVFAGGDAVSGAATVIEAIAAGKRAAISIVRYLRGEDLAAGRTAEPPDTKDIDYYTPEKVEKRPRVKMPDRPLSKRQDFSEIHLGFDEEQAVAEAERCLNCGVCSECLECVRVCEPEAIDHQAQGGTLLLDVGAVILAAGNQQPAASGEHLAATDDREGIYQVEPGDVIQASAAAANVMRRIQSHRARTTKSLAPGSYLVAPRIGVFVCRCGDHISRTVDVKAVVDRVARLPGVVYAQDLPFSCSPEGATIIGKALDEHRLDRVVLAACSCCSLDQVCYSCTYQRVRCKDNLSVWNDKCGFEFVNIREQCAWVHDNDPDNDLTTTKALSMVSAAIARAARLEPLTDEMVALDDRVLVVGEGPVAREAIAALSAQGFKAVTPEPRDTRGGWERSSSWKRPRPVSVSGSVGAFKVTMRQGSMEERLRVSAIVISPRNEGELNRLRSAFAGSDPIGPLVGSGEAAWSPLETRLPGVFLCHPALDYDPSILGLAVAAKVAALLNRQSLRPSPTIARVEVDLCRACGTCQSLCEFQAIQVQKDERGVLVAQVDAALCRGCGTCAAHCPSGAITAGYSTDEQLEAMLEAVLAGPGPKGVVFTCNWNAYSALEMAGLNRLNYPASVRPVKLMCLGRLQPGLVLKAFELGAGGVLLLGCPPGECHYGFGNQQAEELFAQTKALAHLLGLGEERLHLDWMAAEEGESFAQKVRKFAEDIQGQD